MSIKSKLNYFKVGVSYFIDRLFKLRSRKNLNEPIHIIFQFVDHFEPGKNPGRVEEWVSLYEDQVKDFFDSDGIKPQHTWFYPCEQLNHDDLKILSKASFDGLGEIELHLHHKNDNSETLTKIIETGINEYSKVGSFINEFNNKPNFGFVHGNWSLDNSCGQNCCGVNNELSLLKKLGCYADYTFPSNEFHSQPFKINSIYYSIGKDNKKKSYNWGKNIKNGIDNYGDLMIVQGPLCLNWKKRKLKILPGLEDGDVAFYSPPSINRIKLWMNANIHITGQENWVFIKIHTHGAHRIHMASVLGEEMKNVYKHLDSCFNDKKKYFLHYTTSRETYNIIKAAENGENGNPNNYRDYLIKKPLNRSFYSNNLYAVRYLNDNSLQIKMEENKVSEILFKAENVYVNGGVKTIKYPIKKNIMDIEIYDKTLITSERQLEMNGNFNVTTNHQENKYQYFLSMKE